MIRRRCPVRQLLLTAFLVARPGQAFAHSGPPFPILSDHAAGPYEVSLWTDPDATDNGSAAGQFWVMVRLRDGSPLPADTRALIVIRPADRPGPVQSGYSSAVKGDLSRQFVALLMDHEGPFSVTATISSARGSAVIDSTVDATYDLRPARWLLALYVMPFLAVGFLWLKLLITRRSPARR